ncbi:MAG: DUF427 domain-containing protein [Myxococcales bacterium]|nr:DUF427 domain-containing protein [Myxococcales bacterium]
MARDPKYDDLAAARAGWQHRGQRRPPWALTPEPGQESVWDFPRPAVCEPTPAHLVVHFDGVILAETRRGLRALETAHPPTYYFPAENVRQDLLRPRAGTTVCEWKGTAHYWDVVGPSGRCLRGAAWCYPRPFPGFEAIAGCFAFYPQDMDACLVDGERARAQPGGFYAGWVTSTLAGPFKGEAGSAGW